MVKAEIGMDDLSGVDIAQMEQELKDLEALRASRVIPTPVRAGGEQLGPHEDTIPADLEVTAEPAESPPSGEDNPPDHGMSVRDLVDGYDSAEDDELLRRLQTGELAFPEDFTSETPAVDDPYFGLPNADDAQDLKPDQLAVMDALAAAFAQEDVAMAEKGNENSLGDDSKDTAPSASLTPNQDTGTPKTYKAGESNAMKCLRRLVQPRADGSFLVPEEIIAKFKDIAGGGRSEVLRLYEQCGCNKDAFVKTCRRKIEQISEEDLYVEGEFMAEADMADEGYKETRIAAIKAECAKHEGWIRRDKYEKQVKLYWVETKQGGRKLKRKRQVLEEEDEISADEMEKLKNEMEGFPSDFVLPKDTTDPVILVEADGNVDTQKALKALSFPVMDDDALPSSYIQKILGALAKWRVKMNGIIETLDSLEEKPDNVQPLGSRAGQIDKALVEVESKITSTNTQGIIEGFKSEQQDQLEEMFKEARKQCAEALSLATRAQPFLQHIKSQERKRMKDMEKEENPRTPAPARVKVEPKASSRRSR